MAKKNTLGLILLLVLLPCQDHGPVELVRQAYGETGLVGVILLVGDGGEARGGSQLRTRVP